MEHQLFEAFNNGCLRLDDTDSVLCFVPYLQFVIHFSGVSEIICFSFFKQVLSCSDSS